MFHPAAPSSPSGSFSSLTALTRLASREVGAVRASPSRPLLPPVFIPYVALTQFHGPSESSDLAPRFFPPLNGQPNAALLEPSSFSLVPISCSHIYFNSTRRSHAVLPNRPNSNLVNQNLACSATSRHAECTHQSSPSTFPQSLSVMV